MIVSPSTACRETPSPAVSLDKLKLPPTIPTEVVTAYLVTSELEDDEALDELAELDEALEELAELDEADEEEADELDELAELEEADELLASDDEDELLTSLDEEASELDDEALSLDEALLPAQAANPIPTIASNDNVKVFFICIPLCFFDT